MSIRVLRTEGKGRAYVLLREAHRDDEIAGKVFVRLSQRARAVEVTVPTVTAMNWALLTGELRTALREQGLRQISLVAWGAATTIAQNILLDDLRLVRTAVLLDPSTRAHPSVFERCTDRLERWLPLGLPLRLRSPAFDGAPHLHRMRCPILVVSTPRSTTRARTQASQMAAGLPTAWQLLLEEGEEVASVLGDRIVEFQEVPAKCPQRG